ncbi:hypothetical protein FCN80_01280 [Martelella alba]|uniref:Uncharacterized protein n=1 Tax=Martelella alba TaxID=2590451 RepID=A0ABY2SR59_9HYPH|nr:hypothetical protein FCN80_01280 [Martelella alba]
MPFQPSFVNGFVQISAALADGACYNVMAQNSISFGSRNTVFAMKKGILADKTRLDGQSVRRPGVENVAPGRITGEKNRDGRNKRNFLRC